MDKVWEAIPPRLPKNRTLTVAGFWWFGGLLGWVISTTARLSHRVYRVYTVYIHTLHWLKWTICPNFGDSDGIQKFGDSFFFNLVLAEKSFQNIIK